MKKGVDYIGNACVFYCHDGQGNFLLHKRSNKCKDEQEVWDCGGGGLEFGESFEQCVTREIQEEYGCKPLEINYAGTVNVLRKNREGQHTHWVSSIFLVKVDPAEVSLGDPEKMTDIGWFTEDNFPQPQHSMLMKHFELAKKVP